MASEKKDLTLYDSDGKKASRDDLLRALQVSNEEGMADALKLRSLIKTILEKDPRKWDDAQYKFIADLAKEALGAN